MQIAAPGITISWRTRVSGGPGRAAPAQPRR